MLILTNSEFTLALDELIVVNEGSTVSSVGNGFWHFFYTALKPCGPLRHKCEDEADEGDNEYDDAYTANYDEAGTSAAYQAEYSDGVSATGGGTSTGSGNGLSGYSSSSSSLYWIFIVGAIIGLGVALKVSKGLKDQASDAHAGKDPGHGLVQNRVMAWKSYFKKGQDVRASDTGRGIEMGEPGDSKIDFIRVTDDV